MGELLYEHDQDRFDMRIIGYQFPEITDQKDDSNWLVVEIKACVDNQSWEKRDPSITTYELNSLIAWLELIKSGEHTRKDIGFLEPNLSFEFLQRTEMGYRFKAFFELESRPAWASFSDVPWGEFYAVFERSTEEMQKWIDKLRSGLTKFPPRAGLSLSENTF